MEEIWKDIPGFDEYYQVSNFGNVKSKRYGKLMKPCIDGNGYAQIHMSINGKKHVKRISRIVAETFLGKNEKSFACHHGKQLVGTKWYPTAEEWNEAQK